MVMKFRWYNNKSKKQRMYFYVRYFLLWAATVLVFNLLYSFRASTPNTRSMIADNERMVQRIEEMASRIDVLNEQISMLDRRDSGTYRVVFGLEKHNKIEYPKDVMDDATARSTYNDRYNDFIKETWGKIDKTKLSLYNVSVAFDTISSIAHEHVSLTRRIPAIWPIDVRKFTGRISNYGWRTHPILKTRKFHPGFDLSCKNNTEVIATADGVVRYVRNGWNGGYGNEIVLNHGMGYQTRFAHLNKQLVRVGDVVKRGDKIGLAGSTGRSTGTHLHYEVIYQNKTMNPLNYFRLDQSAGEINRMLETAREQVFEDESTNFGEPDKSKNKK